MKKLLIIFIVFLFSCCSTMIPQKTKIIIIKDDFGAYYFYFQQIFVKRYGGVMAVSVPEGQLHLAATWKDDNLWIENYDPVTNTCHFREYSRGNLLQGQVTIKNCNPLLRK